MNRLLLSIVLLLANSAMADDAAEIRKLIPSAAAIATKDFEALATSPKGPREADVEEKSLTLMILAIRISEDDDRAAIDQFKFESKNGSVKPSELAAEMYRVVRLGTLKLQRGPVTAIHADRITKCTCKVDGDKATGQVMFKVPQLYQGKVDYVAKRKGEKWTIVELTMPAREIHIIRDKNGKWKKAATP